MKKIKKNVIIKMIVILLLIVVLVVYGFIKRSFYLAILAPLIIVIVIYRNHKCNYDKNKDDKNNIAPQ